MDKANEILSLALRLSEQDRVFLAHELLLSLEPEDLDGGSAEAWEAELQARLERVEQGSYTATDWQEAVEEIRRSLREGASA